MLKKIALIFVLLFVGCNWNSPTEFSDKALNDSFYTLENKSVKLVDILNQHKGKKIVINVWASWCADCVVGFPKLKEFQKNNPDVMYLFLSINRNIASWKNAINKYEIKGEHYFIKQGLVSDFGDFLNSNWTPRYLVVNENGAIELFKAKKITDPRIAEALKK